MEADLLFSNANVIGEELDWLERVIATRFNLYFEKDCPYRDILDVPPPAVNGTASSYTRFLQQHRLKAEERIIVALALAPGVRPQLLDIFFSKNADYDKEFSEFGGYRGHDTASFIPTIETALFLLSGGDLQKRFHYQTFFDARHRLMKDGIITLSAGTASVNGLSSIITISSDLLEFFSIGREKKPGFSSDFPAQLIETGLEWKDVILDKNTLEQIDEIKAWIRYGRVLMNDWGMQDKMQPGYHCLFHGPPGTGKTLTARLLGKETGRDVYRIDLSGVVSKYIGETEKNLSNIFNRAENKNWILFFDEADALFGKRTEVSDAHDRFANQEVSYLLQRMESFNGVAILASNKKANMDEAFYRRLQNIIYFPIPRPDERYRLWKMAFSGKAVLEDKINLKKVADTYAASGGTIMNVVRYSSLMALKRKEHTIRLEDIEKSIRREFQKEGKTI